MRSLPRVAARFGEGALTWTQVRAITRVCTPAEEQLWLELAIACHGGQLERLVQAVRRSQAAEQDAADPELAAARRRPSVRTRPDGRYAVTFLLEPEEATMVMAGMEPILDQARTEVAWLPVEAPDEPTPLERTEPQIPVRGTYGVFLTEVELTAKRAGTRPADRCQLTAGLPLTGRPGPTRCDRWPATPWMPPAHCQSR